MHGDLRTKMINECQENHIIFSPRTSAPRQHSDTWVLVEWWPHSSNVGVLWHQSPDTMTNIVPTKIIIGQFRQYSILIGQFRQYSTLVGQFKQHSTLIGQFKQYSTLIGQFKQNSTLIGQQYLTSTVWELQSSTLHNWTASVWVCIARLPWSPLLLLYQTSLDTLSCDWLICDRAELSLVYEVVPEYCSL